MQKQLFILLLFCLNNVDSIHAQWTQKDSIWLQQVLSGKEKLELNEETLKAIKSGSLLNTGEPASNMKLSPITKLPVQKDFSEYIQSDSTNQKLALKDLPRYVFWLYEPDPIKPLKLHQSIADDFKRDPMYKTGGFFSIANMTSRKEYVHHRNAKRDGTWKNYNNLPTPDIIKKRATLSPEVLQPKQKDTDSLVIAQKDSLNTKKDSLCLRDSIAYKSPDPEFTVTGLDTLLLRF